MVDTVHNEFDGETVICLASGPSIDQEQVDVIRKTGHPVIAVNNTFQLAPWADIIFAADILWWYRYYDDVVATCHGELWTLDGVGDHFVRRTRRSEPPIKQVAFDRETGLGKTRVNHGGNSGYIAVNLAYLMGAKKIVLVGYDHKHSNEQTHFHGDHETKYFRKNADDTDRWVSNFAWLSYDLNSSGVDLVNCSLDTAIETCRRSTLEAEL